MKKPLKFQLRYQGDGAFLDRCSADLTEMILFSLHDMLYISHRIELVQPMKEQIVEDHAEH